MEQNILVIAGSPHASQGNSDSLADYMAGRLAERQHTVTGIQLRKAVTSPENLLAQVQKADVLVLSFPVYENSVPGSVLAFFELLWQNRDALSGKPRKFLVIGNSGFPEPKAVVSALDHCRSFARAMGFTWLGGVPVSPGTLIDGKKLEETGGTYKKVMAMLDTAAEKISRGEDTAEYLAGQAARPLIAPFLYRFLGKMMQNGTIKKLGKETFFARPLI